MCAALRKFRPSAKSEKFPLEIEICAISHSRLQAPSNVKRVLVFLLLLGLGLFPFHILVDYIFCALLGFLGDVRVVESTVE